jgi:hypothetical protein
MSSFLDSLHADLRDDIAGKYFSELRESRPDYSSTDYFRAFPHQRDADITKITDAFRALDQIHWFLNSATNFYRNLFPIFIHYHIDQRQADSTACSH